MGGGISGVLTQRGSISAPVVVLAAGPYSARVAALAGIDLPLRVIRRHRLTTGEHPLIGPHPDISGLFYNLGYSGHGVMAAPGGSRLLADLSPTQITHSVSLVWPDWILAPASTHVCCKTRLNALRRLNEQLIFTLACA